MPVIPKGCSNGISRNNDQSKMGSSKQCGKEKRHAKAVTSHASPPKTKVKGHAETKKPANKLPPAKSAETPKSTSPKIKGKSGTPNSKSLHVAKKSKSLDSKPKSVPKGPASPTKEHAKSAGRQHLKVATSHSKGPNKTTAKNVQKGVTVGEINAGLAIAYGSAHRVKSVGQSGLLTARYHRSSGSPGEAVTPPYGDIRTMVCDVSPVPSDVESIDYSNSKSKLPAVDKKGLFGRSQQTLRVGHQDRKSSHSAAKGQNLTTHSEDAAKVNKTNKRENSGDNGSAQTIPNTDKTVFKNEKIAVRIVPDSAKHKGEKEITITTPQAKVQTNEANKQQKGATKPSQPVQPPKLPNTRASQPINKPLKAEKSAKIEKTTTSSDTKGKIPTKKEKNCKPQPDANEENASTVSLPNGVSKEPTENAVNISSNGNNKDKDALEETMSIVVPSIHIPADEECCKAYAILNKRGIKVSLHTLRRALLTPTEYRLLQRSSQSSENSH